MTEHDKISSDVEATVGSEQVAAPSKGRRRFTKGALLATPAVMTLASGRLMAQVANSSSCGARIGLTTKDNGNLLFIDQSTGYRVILDDTSGSILRIVTDTRKISYNGGVVTSIKDTNGSETNSSGTPYIEISSEISQAQNLYTIYSVNKGISSCAMSFA